MKVEHHLRQPAPAGKCAHPVAVEEQPRERRAKRGEDRSDAHDGATMFATSARKRANSFDCCW